MDAGGAGRLNRSSPSCLNRPAQRTAFFHGLSGYTKLSDQLREAIFYSSESAYPSQYTHLASSKYRADSQWLLRNKSLSVPIGHRVCRGIYELIAKRCLQMRGHWAATPPSERTILPYLVFSCDEVASHIDQSTGPVRAFVEAFTLPETERNTSFNSINAFNVANIYPFLRKGEDEFVLLQYYTICEAFYDAPFYWMCADKTYAETAFCHRGEYAETLAFESLSRVFGRERVFRSVEIRASKSRTLGEVDVLVTLGNHAIVIQAKTKKLTLEARKGNDGVLRKDFKAAIQNAVDQALSCARALRDPSVTLRAKDGRTVPLYEPPQSIFPLALVADHYPALAVQAYYFLKSKSDEQIHPPLVTDLFALDTITEMLHSPFMFLSYLMFRSRYSGKLLAEHEHILLSYYLKCGPEINDDDVGLVWVGHDLSLELDVAMAARREGIPGARVPSGILRGFAGTPLGRILEDLERRPEEGAINLGLMLVGLKGSAIRELNRRTAAAPEEGGPWSRSRVEYW